MKNQQTHSFHIPVMGLGFTIDTPIKVAKYGINSVISIIEDELIERMRETICSQEKIEYQPISNKDIDHRAKRITAYLNLLQDIIDNQINEIKNQDFETGIDLKKYFELMSDENETKKLFQKLSTVDIAVKNKIEKQLKESIYSGSIDVNIMTKIDKNNVDENKEVLPSEFSDALSALRGYANSRVKSSIIFSAGMNPRLFSYCENFDDFYPNEKGEIKKQIILKVSDYRSALIQGKYLAKKGLWVSEFRIESGINCGGHAFVSNGMLLGPILEEFKNKRLELIDELFEICQNQLSLKKRHNLLNKPIIKITAQGGIGTSQENNFLNNYYELDSTGWGSPFLLVPEATNVDDDTLEKLSKAKKEDYYLSHASPLGVPFNNFRKSSSETQRKHRISKNRAGSPCYKKFLATNTEFTSNAICTASREYQKLKIEELQRTITDQDILKTKIAQVEEKDCLCEGLGASALIVNNAKLSHNLSAVTICPGPNLAYFSGTYSLKQMVDHIYGRLNILNNLNRPNLFINELVLYVDYLKKELERNVNEISAKKAEQLQDFKNNLNNGIDYYEKLFQNIKETHLPKNSLQLLESVKDSLNRLFIPLMPQTTS